MGDVNDVVDGTVVWTDGTRHPNPNGTATFGYVVRRDGAHLHTGRGLVIQGEGASNNVAELGAMYMALKWLCDNPQDGPVTVRADSQLAVNLITRKWKPKKPHLIQHVADIHALMKSLPTVPTFCWISRELNMEADEAAGRAFVEATGTPIPPNPDWWRKKRT